jgi:hypothetical protein
LSAKQAVTPTAAMVSPASAGPVRRAVFITIELSAMAFGTSSGPTISLMKACRVGLSSAVAVPSTAASP